MKKHRVFLVILLISVFMIILLVAFIMANYSISSLSRTIVTPYAFVDEGNGITRYSGGRLRRIAGLPPQIEVSGTHYEMGLQYGVLMKEELVALIREGHIEFFTTLAEDEEIPQWLLMAVLKYKTDSVYAALPDRFKDELQGISKGTGLSLASIKICALFADVLKFMDASQNCSSVLMRGVSGGLIHASNMDDRFGKLQVKYRVVRKFMPTGYASYMDAHNMLYFGVHTGINEYGLAASGQSVASIYSNAQGIGEDYLLRIVLEGAERVGDVSDILKEELPMYGTAMLVSTGNEEGALFDVASGTAPVVDKTPMTEKVLWGINEYKEAAFEGTYGNALINRCENNALRARFFGDYFSKNNDPYSLQNAVEVMRLNGSDVSEAKTAQYLEGVCTVATQKTVIYPEDRKGFYLSTGKGYYSAYSTFYFWDFDFNHRPVAAEDIGTPLDLPADWTDFGELIQGIQTAKTRLEGLEQFAESYPSPFSNFLVADFARDSGDMETWLEYAKRAYTAETDTRYGIEYAHALYKNKEIPRAYSILVQTDPMWTVNMMYRLKYHMLMLKLSKLNGDFTLEEKSTMALESMGLTAEKWDELFE